MFDEIYCESDFTKSKRSVLEKYRDTSYMWIEDRIDYARDGQEVIKNIFDEWHIIEIIKQQSIIIGRVI